MAVETLNDESFKKTLEENDKVAVMYFADWCGSCRLFKPKFRRLSEDERFEGVKFVNINAEQNPDARHTARVDNLPFFAMFKTGEKQDGKATNKEEAVVDMLSSI
ncbi:MAG TPA: thioredoxin [Cytophagales bacterium]|jgi:thioredoxin 1|nr:thioredoxin [Cytophagales bacterium]